MITAERLQQALETTRQHLLAQRVDGTYWEGYLSSSALSTATAVSALCLAKLEQDRPLIEAGVEWLLQTQNADGGWGDTTDSPSNLATTLLVCSALILAEQTPNEASQAYLKDNRADTPQARVQAITRLYGADRTFAVPILMNCALAGLVDWHAVPPLPYEWSVVPQNLLRHTPLQVVSYALPALIAIGIAIEYHRPIGHAFASPLRRVVTRAALRKLIALQPHSGGYLEATPLTAFVCMALLSVGHGDQHSLKQGLQFLRQSMRADGSWPIDTNLSVWVTSSAYNALAHSGGLAADQAARTRKWLAQRQYTHVHPFTGASPGGWGWSHLPGAVPDADDTSGALLALAGYLDEKALQAARKWLVDLQNNDGGWPTFCRGWGKLPFDASCDDITAHALRALSDCRAGARTPPQPLSPTNQAAESPPQPCPNDQTAGYEPPPYSESVVRGLAYLRRRQRSDGSWVPLWFGNQGTDGHLNPVFGTARVLLALAELEPQSEMTQRGLQYLLSAQNPDGGWGGAVGVATSTEETALAVAALAAMGESSEALLQGLECLLRNVEDGTWTRPTPIGLYFASLWYSEVLYPVVWTVEALGRASNLLFAKILK
ncbi:MAG: prenyltransferase/squalene oxidase repeat-containing protein [Armatimonadia bacterium]